LVFCLGNIIFFGFRFFFFSLFSVSFLSLWLHAYQLIRDELRMNVIWIGETINCVRTNEFTFIRYVFLTVFLLRQSHEVIHAHMRKKEKTDESEKEKCE